MDKETQHSKIVTSAQIENSVKQTTPQKEAKISTSTPKRNSAHSSKQNSAISNSKSYFHSQPKKSSSAGTSAQQPENASILSIPSSSL